MKKMPKGRPFVKGKSGNPLGARLHDQNIKQLRNIVNSELQTLGGMLMNWTYDDIIRYQSDRSIPLLQSWFIRLALKSMRTGDSRYFFAILNRLLGKP